MTRDLDNVLPNKKQQYTCKPMYTTSVVFSSTKAEVEASRASSPPSREWPVRKRTLVARPRWVKGIPRHADIPEAAVIPALQYDAVLDTLPAVF